mgnify:CR=1 FL=1
MISIFESKGIEPVIVITKQDLRECEDFAGIYRSCGFKVFYMDNSTGNGIDVIRSYISGKLSALIGNSGVGKSSLMNHLFPDLREVREISARNSEEDVIRQDRSSCSVLAAGILRIRPDFRPLK